MTFVVTIMVVCPLFVVPLFIKKEDKCEKQRTNVLLWRLIAHRLHCLIFHTDLIALPLLLPFSGAYLVPYFILLILIGIPLFFLELAVGQRIRRGSIGVWNYVYPQLGGIGVSSLMVMTSLFTRKHELECWLGNILRVRPNNLSLSNKGRYVNHDL